MAPVFQIPMIQVTAGPVQTVQEDIGLKGLLAQMPSVPESWNIPSHLNLEKLNAPYNQ